MKNLINRLIHIIKKNNIYFFIILLPVLLIVFSQKEYSVHDARGGGGSVCTACHQLHGGTSVGGPLLLASVAQTNVCLSCHLTGGDGDQFGFIPKTHSGSTYGAFERTCTECHTPHVGNTGNIRLIRGATATVKVQGVVSTGPTTYGDTPVIFMATSGSTNAFATGIGTTGLCEVCHSQTKFFQSQYASYGVGSHPEPATAYCTQTCHSHANDFRPAGGGCLACHGGARPDDTGDGIDRRSIGDDFLKTSHHVRDGKDGMLSSDCAVCHWEGNIEADGSITLHTTYHKNSKVDLRHADSNAVITLASAANFTRNTTVTIANDPNPNTNNIDPTDGTADIQDFCMACHDSNGANAIGTSITTLGASHSATKPFSSMTRSAVPDVFTAFATSNSNFHPVRGTRGNTDAQTTLISPWDTGGPHTISCFDCHEANAHGGANTRILREDTTSINFAAMQALKDANPTSEIQDGQQTAAVNSLCSKCHDFSTLASVWVANTGRHLTHGDGSDSGTKQAGCFNCHGSPFNFNITAAYTDPANAKPTVNGGAAGSIHGNNFKWAADHDITAAQNVQSFAFAMGGYLTYAYGAGGGTCSGGDCSHGTGARNF
ncbi:MAG: hypothetical protein OEZ22_10260 [Spirochaetia bacterium]|nr:hypothetical protein [Spirochaetia bacterium]